MLKLPAQFARRITIDSSGALGWTGGDLYLTSRAACAPAL